MIKVVVYDQNLITSSKISSALKVCGFDVERYDPTLSISDDGSSRVFVINLESPGGLDLLRRLVKLENKPRVIGFCGHKNQSLIKEAQELGADQVVPNSAIVSSICKLIRDLY